MMDMKKLLKGFTVLNDSKYLDILITTFNRQVYLERCILSIHAASTLPVRIFVGDDHSTDGTLKLLEDYKQQQRITDYFQPSKKAGTANLFNMLINRFVKSNYFIISNDDMWFRYQFDIMLATYLKKYQTAASISFYDFTNLKIGTKSKYVETNLVETVSTGLGCSLLNKTIFDKTLGFILPPGRTMGFFASKWCEVASKFGKHYCIVPAYAKHMDNVASLLNERINLGAYIDYRVKNKR